ncbi:shikimate kinase [bacterium]|nr:shikimate kinase [bacterium]
MGNNIILIGMAGAGKSTIGVQLAKWRGMEFIDTDILIQTTENKTLQNIIDEHDYLHLRQVEERVLLAVKRESTIIATGGSVIYSDAIMQHMISLGTIVYLKVDFDEIARRVGNVDTRGIACAPGMSFEDIYNEREPLYHRYAHITIDNNVALPIEQLNRRIDSIVS